LEKINDIIQPKRSQSLSFIPPFVTQGMMEENYAYGLLQKDKGIILTELADAELN